MEQQRGLVWRLRLEAFFCILGLCLLAATLIQPAWIEAITGMDPDQGSGSFEAAICITIALITVLLAWRARADKTRLRLIWSAASSGAQDAW